MAAETPKRSNEPAAGEVTVVKTESDSFLDQIREIEDRVMRRAYDIFVKNGSQEGRATEDWCVAERELVWKPAIQVREASGRFEIQVAVAGVNAKDLRIEASPQDVLIKGKTQTDRVTKAEKSGLHVCEFHSVGCLFRSISLPKKIDPGRVKAKLKDGLLTIAAPIPAAKAPTAPAKKNESGLRN